MKVYVLSRSDMKFPSHLELVENWLLNKFHGIPCIVFFDPIGKDGSRAAKIIQEFNVPLEECGELINSDVFILPHTNPNSIVNNLNEDEYGYVMSWSGTKFTTENT